MGRTRSLVGILSAALLATSVNARAAAPETGSAAALLDRAFRNLYADDYVQTLVLATESRGGREMRRRLQLLRRQSVRPGKALLRFLYPQTIRRTSVLILENEGESDDFYVYLPAVKMTRHLTSAQKGDSFFGTDLSYEDVEPKRVEDFVVRWLPGQGDADGRPCRLLEIVAAPGYESAYEKQISCIEDERAIILWSDYYAKGRRLKRLTIDPAEVRVVGRRYIPYLIRMETPSQRSVTKVITEDYDLKVTIDEKVFNSWNLAAGDAASDRRKTSGPELGE